MTLDAPERDHGPDAATWSPRTGRYEHLPLRFAEIDPDDLATLAAATRALGQGLAARPHGDTADILGDYARTRDAHGRASAADLLTRLARVHGLLDLGWTDDTVLHRGRLAGAYGDVVLDDAAEAAYQRTADRLNNVWSSGSGLDRYLY